MTENPLFPRDFDLDGDPVKAFTAGKMRYLVQITNEQMDNALVWPIQVLDPEPRAAARKERELVERQFVDETKARLGKADIALAPIIALHYPSHDATGLGCNGCDAGAYAEDTPEWPCRTIELILEGLDD